MDKRLCLKMYIFVVSSIITTMSANETAILESEFIYPLGKKPTPQCHASTIVQTTKGTLMCAWFGGTKEGNSDVSIWISRFKNKQWTSPIKVADGIQYTTTDGKEIRYPCWNPVLFQPTKSPLILFYKVGKSPESWWGMLMTSDDDGKTWHSPTRLPEGIIGPVKNKPIELQDGRILCGSSTEDNGWTVHFEYTYDYGKTFKRTPPINNTNEISSIQPCFLKHPDGTIQSLGRSAQGKIWQCFSTNNGDSWTKMNLTTLPNPNSGIDAVTLRDGKHILVYNHTKKGRSPLNIAVSEDGKHWYAGPVLEDEEGEFSYPAIIQTDDNMVHITYTYKRIGIKHVKLDPSLITTKDFTNNNSKE